MTSQSSSPTISRLLRQMEDDNSQVTISRVMKDMEQGQKNYPSHAYSIPLLNYHCSRAELKRQIEDEYRWQDIFKNGDHLSSTYQLTQLYSLLNHQILQTKYPRCTEKAQATDKNINYLTLKSQAFHNLFRPAYSLQELDELSYRGFQVQSLLRLAEFIYGLKIKLLEVLKEVNEHKHWFLKGMGFILIHQMSAIIAQIKLAAYPFLSDDDIIEVISIEVLVNTLQDCTHTLILTQEQDKIRLADKKQAEKFSKYQTSTDYLRHAQELLQQRITQTGETEGGENFGQQLTSIDQSVRVRHSQAQLHSALLYIKSCKYLQDNFLFGHKKNNLLEVVGNIVSKDPFLQCQERHLVTLGSCQDIIALNLNGYQYFYYKVAHKLNSYSNQYQIKQLLSVSQTILKILSGSLSITRSENIRLLAFENYLSILKNINTYDKNYIYIHKEQIQKVIRSYLGCLNQKMSKLRLKLKIEIVRIDQYLTYQLLTNQTILSQFQHFSREATQALSKIIPVLLLQTKVHILHSLVHAKQIEINQLLKTARYFSLINQYHPGHPDEEEQDGMEKPLLVLLEEICSHNPYLAQELPHVIELKNILLFLEVLRAGKRKTHKHQEPHPDFKFMEEVAAYFSYQRSKCKIYQLKSKIVLFVTLFKMGHYIPKLLERGQVVNLRQRIINLMVRQGTSGNFQTRLAPSVIRRNSYTSSLIAYSNQQRVLAQISNIMERQKQQKSIGLEASPELRQKVQDYIQGLEKQHDEDWISYITQRLNILEHQLFLQERRQLRKEQEYLSEEYARHIQDCLSEFRQLKNLYEAQIKTLIDIQRLFFQENYLKGWQKLQKQIAKNTSFQPFLNKIIETTNNKAQIFKFLNIYRRFDRIQPLLSPLVTASQQDINPEELSEIVKIINQDSLYHIEEEPILALLQQRARAKTVKFVQQKLQEDFYLSESDAFQNNHIQQENLNTVNLEQNNTQPQLQKKLSNVSQKETEVQVQGHRLSTYGIRVVRKKQQLRIRLKKKFKEIYEEVSQVFRELMKMQNKGISRVKKVSYVSGKTWKEALQIVIQSNPLRVSEQQLRPNLNKYEHMAKIVLDKIVHTLGILLRTSKVVNFEFDLKNQVVFDTQAEVIEINPCMILLESIIAKESHNSSNIHLSHSIQQLIDPLRSRFQPAFDYSYVSLCRNLRDESSFSKENLSIFLGSPIFMTPSDQIAFLLNYAIKVDALQRQFQSFARLSKIQQQVINKRLKLMQDQKKKNHAYYFRLGSVIEEQLVEEHYGYKEGSLSRYEYKVELFGTLSTQPKVVKANNESHSTSLANLPLLQHSLIQKLRRIKKRIVQGQSQQQILSDINKHQPKLIQYLMKTTEYIGMDFSKSMQDRTRQLFGVFMNSDIKSALYKQIDSPQSLNLTKYEQHFINSVFKKLTFIYNQYACPKCLAFFRVLQKLPKQTTTPLLEALQGLCLSCDDLRESRVRIEDILTCEHNNFRCFINERLKTHPVVQWQRQEIKKPMPQYYLVLNWWFYLQYNYPLLTDILKRLSKK